MNDDGKIDDGILETIVAEEEGGIFDDESSEGVALLRNMAAEIREFREDASRRERQDEFSRRYVKGLQDQIEKLINLDEGFVVKELHSIVKQIAGAGVTGGDFIGLRFSVYQIHELMVRLGLKPEKPNERYIPYVDLLTKYGATSAALEAALQDLQNPDNINAKTVFNMRRLLSIGPDENPVNELEKLLNEMTSGVVSVEHVKMPAGSGYPSPKSDIPDPNEVH